MSNVAIVYWSGTGNTEAMADLIAQGVRAAAKSVAWTRSAVPPAARTPCAMRSAMASVLPMPLQ